MTMAMLILGVLSMVQSESPLILEAAAARENGQPAFVARLRNRSSHPCSIVLNDCFCRIETRLFDEKGKLLEPRDIRATQGVPIPPDHLDSVTIAPGATVDVMTLGIVVDYANAMAGPLSWQIQDLAGQTLKVEFSYALPEESLPEVNKRGVTGATTGSWTSPKIDVPTAPLSQTQVNKILSSHRRIQNPATIPLLVKALDSHQNEETREWAAVSLGDLQAKAASSTLARVLLQDSARVVRICAAVALRDIADPETREALTKAAREDSDSLVRSRAEEALEKLPRKE